MNDTMQEHPIVMKRKTNDADGYSPWIIGFECQGQMITDSPDNRPIIALAEYVWELQELKLRKEMSG